MIFCFICESAGEGIPKDMTCHPIWIKPYSSTLMASKLRHQFKNNNRVSLISAEKVHYSEKRFVTFHYMHIYVEGICHCQNSISSKLMHGKFVYIYISVVLAKKKKSVVI